MYLEKEIKVTYPADLIMRELIDQIIKLKVDFIKGVYLTGSIPLNDFNTGKSDIDFVVLCGGLPDSDFRSQLKKVHRTIKWKFKKSNLSGCYITYDDLNVQRPQTTQTLCYHEGRMGNTGFEMAPVTLYELKTTAITLFGIPAPHLPITIDISNINQFLFKNINTYWKGWIDQHSSFGWRKLLLVLIPRLTEWTILGLARQLYTLRTGKIISKTGAGHCCLDHMPARYQPVVQEAIKIRNSNSRHFLSIKSSYYLQPSIKRARETIACANYIIQLFNKEYKEKTSSR